MTVCEECGFDWACDPRELVALVDEFGPAYRAHLEAILKCDHGDSLVRTRPAPGVWSALEYAAHVRDVVRFYRMRFTSVLEHERPRMRAANFSAMADEHGYNTQNPNAVISAIEYETARAKLLLETLSPAQWERVGVGSEGGERSVLVLARRLAHDGHHHLFDLERGWSALID